MTATYNPTDRKPLDAARAEQAKQAAARAERWTAAVKHLMSTAGGRDIVFWLLQQSTLFDEPFAENGLRLAHNAGKQWLGREIHNAVLAACPEQFVEMMKEHKRDGGITAVNGRAN